MSVVARTLAVQRRVVALMLVGTALLFYRRAFTGFSMLKGTVILVAVLALVVVSAYRAARLRRLHLPVGLPVWVAMGFAGALVVSTALSSNPLGSLAGQGGRFTGLVMHGAHLLVV